MTLSLEYESKASPPLQFEDSSLKWFVTGAIKTFDDCPSPTPEHRFVVTKRHFFYNRQVNGIRCVNRVSMKFADVEVPSPIEQMVSVHFESTSVVALLRDGSVCSIVATDLPDKTVKLSFNILSQVPKASCLAVLQGHGTTHSAASQWVNKKVLVFSADPLTCTRIIPSDDGSSCSKAAESFVADKSWASHFGNAASSAASGPNGFVSCTSATTGAVQVLHESDLSSGALSKPLTAHGEIGAECSFFVPRDTVTDDADPTASNASSSSKGSSTIILTAAKGGHEIRLWSLKGSQISLVQTITITNDTNSVEAEGDSKNKNNNNRSVTMDPSGDMVFLVSQQDNKKAATIIGCELESNRGAIRRITEWGLPFDKLGHVVSACACPMKQESTTSRFCIFSRAEKGVSRLGFDNRISGAANVASSSSGETAAAATSSSTAEKAADSASTSTSAAAGDTKKSEGGGDSNVSKWFGGASTSASAAVTAGGSSTSSKEITSVKRGGERTTTTIEGGASKAEINSAISTAVTEVTSQHMVSANRFFENAEDMIRALEQALGQALGSLRLPAIRHKSQEVAAEFARKAVGAIDSACKQAAKKASDSSPPSSSSSSNGPISVQGFSPLLAQEFYTQFLTHIHKASSTVVDHSLDQLLETAIAQALEKTWPAIEQTVDRGESSLRGSGERLVPKVSGLSSFQEFRSSIDAAQAGQNASVKRQVTQNQRDLEMYTKSAADAQLVVRQGEQWLTQMKNAVRDLDAAVVSAKSSGAPMIAGVEVATAANEEEILKKILGFAQKGQWQQATTGVANGASLSLLSRFFENDAVHPNMEEICCLTGLTAAAFVSCLKILTKGLNSATPVAVASRVNLLKEIVVAYSLDIDNNKEDGEAKSTLAFLKSQGGEIDMIRQELSRVQGERTTTRHSTLAARAIGMLLSS